MSMTIYAATNGSVPAGWANVFPFEAHAASHYVPRNPDQPAAETIEVANPAHIPDSGVEMSEGNVREMLALLGFPRDQRPVDGFLALDLPQVLLRCTETLGDDLIRFVGDDLDTYWRHRLTQIQSLATKGAQAGATHILFE